VSDNAYNVVRGIALVVWMGLGGLAMGLSLSYLVNTYLLHTPVFEDRDIEGKIKLEKSDNAGIVKSTFNDFVEMNDETLYALKADPNICGDVSFGYRCSKATNDDMRAYVNAAIDYHSAQTAQKATDQNYNSSRYAIGISVLTLLSTLGKMTVDYLNALKKPAV